MSTAPLQLGLPPGPHTQSAAVCAETEVGNSVEADYVACAGVSELADDVACLAILTDSAVDDAAAKACTYVAAVSVITAGVHPGAAWTVDCWVQTPLPSRAGQVNALCF